MTKYPLSDREIELLRLVATGASNKEISRQLHISVNTVKVHIRNIFNKLEVSSRTEAAMWAVQNGIVDSGEQGHRSVKSDQQGQYFPYYKRFLHKSQRVSYGLLGFAVFVFVIVSFGIIQILQLDQDPNLTPDVISATAYEQSRWKQLADMPTARSGLAVAAYDNQIYAIAGGGFDGVLDVNERYDPFIDSWETLAPKPVAVNDVHASVIGGRIIIPGGQLPDGSVTDILEVFDPRLGEWSQGARLPKPVCAYALTTFEGKLYVFGGWDGQKYLDKVFVYDPDQDSWVEMTPMPTARAYAGATEAGGKIYVIGGYDGKKALNLNEVYTPAMDDGIEIAWSDGVHLSEGRYSFGVIYVGDKLMVFGGINGSDIGIDAFEYSIQNFSWNKFTYPYDNSSWAKMGVVNSGNQVYFLGGLIDTGPTSMNMAYTAFYTVILPIIEK